MTQIFEGSHVSGSHALPGVEPHPVEIRMCAGGCGTRLSATNRTQICGACERHPSGRSLRVVRVECSADGCEERAVKNSEGQRDSRLRRLCAEHFGDALERVFEESRSKTLEGAVPLPGVVRIRERSYAEMMAITPKPKVTHLPVRDTRMRSETGDVAPSPKKAPSKRTAPTPRTGPCPDLRKVDYAEVARVYRECGILAETARLLGCTSGTVRRAVKAELGADEAAALRRRPAHSGGRLRAWDPVEAVRLFRECGNVSQVARTLGVTNSPVGRVLMDELGDEYEEIRRRARERRGRTHAAIELEAQLDAIEVELEEVAELIRQADEVAA